MPRSNTASASHRALASTDAVPSVGRRPAPPRRRHGLSLSLQWSGGFQEARSMRLPVHLRSTLSSTQRQPFVGLRCYRHRGPDGLACVTCVALPALFHTRCTGCSFLLVYQPGITRKNNARRTRNLQKHVVQYIHSEVFVNDPFMQVRLSRSHVSTSSLSRLSIAPRNWVEDQMVKHSVVRSRPCTCRTPFPEDQAPSSTAVGLMECPCERCPKIEQLSQILTRGVRRRVTVLKHDSLPQEAARCTRGAGFASRRRRQSRAPARRRGPRLLALHLSSCISCASFPFPR